MLRVGWFSTARGDSSRNLLDSVLTSIKNKDLDASIEYVFCSRERGESPKTDLFIDQVQSYQIPLVCLSVRRYAEMFQEKIAAQNEILPLWRLEYDRQIMTLLEPFKVDICLLAGYMLIVGQEMCEKYDMINLHPALPNGPKGTWQEVIWQLIANNATESGVMMHLVTPQLDRGPVVTFCRYPITGGTFDKFWNEIKGYRVEKIKTEQGENNELFKRIRREGFIRETPLIIETLKAFSYGDIKISYKTVFDRNSRQIKGYDLTDRINELIIKHKYINEMR